MRVSFGLRGRRMALVSLAIFAIAGGIAYAAIPDAGTGAYHACMLKSIGTIRIIDPEKQRCSASLETAITIGAKGDQGIQGPQGLRGPAGADGSNGSDGSNGANGADGSDGVSPTVVQLGPGDQNCPGGGAAIKDAAGATAYVCDGANGRDGTNGTNGADGQPFSGSFTSPNGRYSISVTDTGVRISSVSGSSVVVTDSDITVRSKGTASLLSDTGLTVQGGSNLTVRSGSNLTLRGDSNVAVQGGASTTVQGGGALTLTGGTVGINGGGSCAPAVRLSDVLKAVDSFTGQSFVSDLAPGSATVCIGG